MPVKIGYKASAEQFGPRELVEVAVQAEEVGLDSVWVSDHLQPWRHTGGHAPFSLAWMAAVGERTERVQIGTSVLTPTFRNHPAVMAQAFATMGSLYPGRIALGIGSGEALNEVSIGAVDTWPDFKERFARLRESVRLMRALWREDGVTFDGDYYRLDDVTLYDRPGRGDDAPEVPIYIAAGGPTMAKYAGRMGDGFICTSGKGRSLYVDDLLPAVAEGRSLGKKADQPLDRMIEIKLSWDPDPALAQENCRFWAPLSLTPEQKHSVHSSQEMEALADELPIEQVTKRWIVASTPEDAVAACREYVEMGFDHLVLHGPGDDQSRFLTTLAEQVLPGLRELG